MNGSKKLDFIFKNATMHTLEGHSISAMGVANGVIEALGSFEELKAHMGSETVVVDLQGKTVLPGFNDSHLHLISYGFQKNKVCLEGLTSVQAMIRAGQEHLKLMQLQEGQWLEGWGWNQNGFVTPTLPTKEDLDCISTDVPIMYTRVCCHIAVVNSKAIEWVNAQMGQSLDDHILQEGIIREGELDLFYSCMPKPSRLHIQQALLSAMDEAVGQGLTSLQTSDLHGLNLDDVVAVYQELDAQGKLKARVNLQLYLPKIKQLEDFIATRDKFKTTSNRFKLGPLKLLLDGSLGARTAALREDYWDEAGNKGLLTYTAPELENLVNLAHKNGMQLSLHAIGDQTLDEALKAIEKAINEENETLKGLPEPHLPREHRHRINHCQITHLSQMEKMAELGVMGDVQPIFVSSDWNMVAQRVGEARARYSYAWQSLKNKGVKLAGSSDCPIEPFNPLWGIYASVTRCDLTGQPKGGWHSDEKLSLDEALQLFTIGSAYATFEESLKGTLSVGKWADFVVLSEDPYKIPAENLKDVRVLATFVDGKAVFDAVGFTHA